jgi:indole-3-glycerol phosphate synthase
MMTADLLDTIVAAARRIVEVRETLEPMALLEKRIQRRPGREAFDQALRSSPPPRVIAECKRRSPSRGILRREYDPPSHALACARAGAVAISVLTEPTFFDGSPEHLPQVRAVVDLPILRKDFILSEYQLVEAAALGADAVLLIVAALDDATLRRLIERTAVLNLAALVEVHSLPELHRAVEAGARTIGVNSRNLRNLRVEANVFDEVITGIPSDVTAVAESGIRTTDDIVRLSKLGYHAFLIGEQLISSEDPGAALRELRGAGGDGGHGDPHHRGTENTEIH